jgi:hypothetical protein
VKIHSSQEFFTITEILDALLILPTQRTQRHFNQVATALKNLGYKKERPTIREKRVWAYAKPARLVVRKSFNSLTPVKGV